jgi:hypothetical protein
MIDWFNSGANIPIGLLKDRRPLGHSGHLKLQLVVGSIDIAIGKPL